ncbi:hypothetical protein [Desulfopila sp. IMCC35006]|nr:hypothetical protein [Desulfopila sp. IMCC35006]
MMLVLEIGENVVITAGLLYGGLLVYQENLMGVFIAHEEPNLG